MRTTTGSPKHRIFEVDLGYDGTRRQMRELGMRAESFVTSQIRKQRVEVSEKHLTAEQLKELAKAKDKEVQNYLRNQAVEAIAKEYDVPVSELMRMRWVITVKEYPDGSNRVKARLCILGFQDPDLEAEVMETATPTPNRRTRNIFFAACAQRRFKILKADVTSAFLQGDPLTEPKHCIPVKELADALGIPRGKLASVRKGIYGLLKGPRLWVEHVFRKLEKDGWEQCYLDPCTWKLYDPILTEPDGRPLMVGLLSFHIDDFLLGGEEGNATWDRARESLREAWEWSEWESTSFKITGIDVEQLPDYSIRLDQGKYLKQMEPIGLTPSRKKERLAKVTERERSELRGLLGGLLWPATQTVPVACLLQRFRCWWRRISFSRRPNRWRA